MGMRHVFAEADNANKNRVLRETWGHLAPKKNKKYRGHITFACTEYGRQHVLINASFDVPDSPWFYDAMYTFISDQLWDSKLERGVVYYFEGVFCNYTFTGPITRVLLTERVAV